MVEIAVCYEGNLRTRATHGPSGAHLTTDAPRDNQGMGEGFSPTDLLAAALCSCMLTVMGIAARSRGWELDGSRGRVEKHMVNDPARRVGRIVLEMAMAPGLPSECHEILEKAARTCPVASSIHSDVAIELRFDWPEPS